eukprot:RCo045953
MNSLLCPLASLELPLGNEENLQPLSFTGSVPRPQFELRALRARHEREEFERVWFGAQDQENAYSLEDVLKCTPPPEEPTGREIVEYTGIWPRLRDADFRCQVEEHLLAAITKGHSTFLAMMPAMDRLVQIKLGCLQRHSLFRSFRAILARFVAEGADAACACLCRLCDPRPSGSSTSTSFNIAPQPLGLTATEVSERSCLIGPLPCEEAGASEQWSARAGQALWLPTEEWVRGCMLAFIILVQGALPLRFGSESGCEAVPANLALSLPKASYLAFSVATYEFFLPGISADLAHRMAEEMWEHDLSMSIEVPPLRDPRIGPPQSESAPDSPSGLYTGLVPTTTSLPSPRVSQGGSDTPGRAETVAAEQGVPLECSSPVTVAVTPCGGGPRALRLSVGDEAGVGTPHGCPSTPGGLTPRPKRPRSARSPKARS